MPDRYKEKKMVVEDDLANEVVRETRDEEGKGPSTRCRK